MLNFKLVNSSINKGGRYGKKKVKRMGRPNKGNTWIHNSVWLKDSVWNKVRYHAAATCKTTSAWLLDYVYNYKGEVPVFPKDRNEHGMSHSVCVPLEKWSIIQQRANKCDMSTSYYVSNILQTI